MNDVPPAAQAPDDPFRTMPGTVSMQLTVVASGPVSPSLQRLVLTAPELGDFGYRPGQDVMLLVDRDGDRPVRRRYTIRALDPGRQLLTLDIVRHAQGPGERWVRAVAPGVTVDAVGPRGKISPVPDADWHLFIGDESGLAAIFAMVESLPPQASATVILEVSEPADEQELRAGPGRADLAAPAGQTGRRAGCPGRRGGGRDDPGRAVAARVSHRRGAGGLGPARDAAGPRARAWAAVAQGLLGPRPGERQPRRAGQGRLTAPRPILFPGAGAGQPTV